MKPISGGLVETQWRQEQDLDLWHLGTQAPITLTHPYPVMTPSPLHNVPLCNFSCGPSETWMFGRVSRVPVAVGAARCFGVHVVTKVGGHCPARLSRHGERTHTVARLPHSTCPVKTLSLTELSQPKGSSLSSYTPLSTLTAPGGMARTQTSLGFRPFPPRLVKLIQLITGVGASYSGEVGLESFPLALNEALKKHLIHIPKHCYALNSEV